VHVLGDGRVVVFAQCVPGVLIYDPQGRLTASWGDRFMGAHGLSVVEENGEAFLWLVDEGTCEVCKTTLDGKLVMRLDHPPVERRPKSKYVPTWAAQNPANGDVWVGDGYGGSAVNRYAKNGELIGQLLGDEPGGAGRFDSPHGLAFGPDGLLYLTDRANHRVCVYDGDGRLVRHSDTACHSPCSFAFYAGHVVVAELMGAVKLLDQELNVLATLGANDRIGPPAGWEGLEKWSMPDATRRQGWPNVAGTPLIQAGTFSSPHGIAASPNGDIYVVEWIIGGRVIKLERM
jgi:DNA-binding beta-propeller fold protein YncE